MGIIHERIINYTIKEIDSLGGIKPFGCRAHTNPYSQISHNETVQTDLDKLQRIAHWSNSNYSNNGSRKPARSRPTTSIYSVSCL